MAYAKDMVGCKCGKLLVISRNLEVQKEYFEKYGKWKSFWNCNCDCGKRNVVKSGAYLRSKNLKHEKSCGCVADITKHLTKNNKFNNYNLDGDFGIGYIDNNKCFYFDLEDYDKIKNYCWHLNGKGYVVANSKDTTNSTISLSRLVMNVTNPSILVDHKSWNLCDNRKSNLRIANRTENNINIHRKSNNTSGYTGVYKTRSNAWKASISINNEKIYLGTYPTFEEAVVARHKAEKILHKEWSGEINRKDFQKIFAKETLNE